MFRFFVYFCLLWFIILPFCRPRVLTTRTWTELISTDGVRFSPRNAHATCVFNGEIWLTGGRSDKYQQYNFLDSYKNADVWHSVDGTFWKPMSSMTGDFYAQNYDAIQPGPIAPWYARYGHTLNAYDMDFDGVDDLMILSGGYAPGPSNDLWFTQDGIVWVYGANAPWSPRAFHSAVVHEGRYYVMGGTPLNNDVWYGENIQRINKASTPLTRYMYLDYTYKFEWKQLDNAPWSPRVGMTVLSHMYWNSTKNESSADAVNRMILIGGYGGFTDPSDSLYDGMQSRAETWESQNGSKWKLLNDNCTFGPLAWTAVVKMAGEHPSYDARKTANTSWGPVEWATDPFILTNTAGGIDRPATMYLIGGGFIGTPAKAQKKLFSMTGSLDAYWSIDGITWHIINYREGGGTSVVPLYSSQEWTKSTVDSRTVYLGLWGHTLVSFNSRIKKEWPSYEMILLAGDKDGNGLMSNQIFKSQKGLFCDYGGVTCSFQGVCGPIGCVCNDTTWGEYCQFSAPVIESSASGWRERSRVSLVLFVSLWFIYSLDIIN